MKRTLPAASVGHLMPACVYGFFYLLWFDYLESEPQKDYLILGNSLDDAIPFIEVFVIPYLSWFVFMLGLGLWLNFSDREAFDRMITMCMIGMTFFLLVSTFVPTALNLRPGYIGRDNIFVRMCLDLWEVDTPTNVWPSIHVYNTAVIISAVIRSDRWQTMRNRSRGFLITWAALIILSTVFIKQHSMLDVLAGGILALVVNYLTYEEGLVLRWKRWDAYLERRALKRRERELM
ncbi:MAG: phosphatase PAP2 family protein [Lachnospiraceae bacterium]|nr:phosphatase PAP2 family protein [Lachnospiraceae bacterium]